MTDAPPSLRYQFANYRKRLGWLVTDLWRSQWRQIIRLVAMDATASAFFLAWLVGLLFYGQALESGDAYLIPLLNVEVSPADSAVIPWVGLLSLAGMIGGALLYRSELRAAQITINYHRHCLSRLHRILAFPQFRRWPQIFPDEPRSLITQMGSMGLHLTAMSARRLLRMVLPAVILPCALVVLVQVNVTLTLLLIPLCIGYLIPLYVVNRHAARVHLRFATLHPENTSRLMRMFRATMDQTDAAEQHVAKFDEYLQSTAYNEASQVFHARRMVEDRMSFVNTQLAVIAFFMLFVYATFTIDNDTDISWTSVLAYLVALRFAISAANQVTSSLAAISRFMPEFEKYAHFVESAQALATEVEHHGDTALPDSLSLRDPISDHLHPVQPGQLCWVLCVTGNGGPESLALAQALQDISGIDLTGAYLSSSHIDILASPQWSKDLAQQERYQFVLDSAPSRFLLEPDTIPVSDIDLLLLFDGRSVVELIDQQNIARERQRINQWWISQKQRSAAVADDATLMA